MCRALDRQIGISTHWLSLDTAPFKRHFCLLWPLLPVVVRLGVPFIPKAKIAGIPGKTALKTLQVCHHFQSPMLHSEI